MWLWGGLCFLLGFLLSFMLFHWRYRRSKPQEIELLLELTSEDERISSLQAHIDYLEHVIIDYQDYVAEHFDKTAEYVNHFSDSYQALFDHLQTDAFHLVDAKELAKARPRLPSKR